MTPPRREFLRCRSRNGARALAPWALIIAKVEEGFMAFETRADFKSWKQAWK